MFTDIAGYTATTQSDEAGALRLLREQERLLRPLLEAHRGRKVKSMGDGLLIEFPDALDAVQSAVELQRLTRERNAQRATAPLRLRVGIHLGDVQGRGRDILGDAVNIASRVEPLADPGGVCLTAQVFVQVQNKVPYRFDKLGPKQLKGVREPIDIYRIVLPWASEPSTPSEPTHPRLAVLPLANISPDPGDEYFADGLTEELISVLSQARGLRVIARTSVMPYKAATKSIAQIGSELGVDSVLEGSVRKAGNQLRISVQLIDVRTQEHRWAQSYDRKLENVFAIQAEVAEKTAEALKVELLRPEREAIQERPTSNLVAYEFYLRGIEESRRIGSGGSRTEEIGRRAWRYFEEAIREDPEFSAAHAYLANHLLALMGEDIPASEVVSRIRELVARALELNPDSSEAHTARGNLAMQVDHDWVRAEAEFQQAIALNPSSSLAHFWYGNLLHFLQRFGECEKQHCIAIELDPLWVLPRENLVWSYAFSGDLESAIANCEKAAQTFRDSGSVRVQLAWLYAFAGRAADAMAVVEPMKDVQVPDVWFNPLGVLAFLGQREGARTLLADWKEHRLSGYLSLGNAAAFYALVGERSTALELFEQASLERDVTVWAGYQAPWFDSIRGDPRFVAILRSAQLPTSISRPLMPGVPDAQRGVNGPA